MIIIRKKNLVHTCRKGEKYTDCGLPVTDRALSPRAPVCRTCAEVLMKAHNEELRRRDELENQLHQIKEWITP